MLALLLFLSDVDVEVAEDVHGLSRAAPASLNLLLLYKIAKLG